MYIRKENQFLAQYTKNWSKERVFWPSLLNQKPDMLPDTTKLVLLHKHSITIVERMQGVNSLDTLLHDRLKMLANMEELEFRKHQEGLERLLINKK